MSTNLELFVLAMVRQGLATPYELKTKAGLSLGSTVPVLARLKTDALVKASKEGARRSRKFSITAKGTRALTQGWAEQLATEHTDLDSILRVACLAWLSGDTKACREFMKRSAGGLRGWAGSLRAEADRLATKVREVPDGDTFVWLRTHCEASRAETDAAALVELSDQITKKIGKLERQLPESSPADQHSSVSVPSQKGSTSPLRSNLEQGSSTARSPGPETNRRR